MCSTGFSSLCVKVRMLAAKFNIVQDTTPFTALRGVFDFASVRSFISTSLGELCDLRYNDKY